MTTFFSRKNFFYASNIARDKLNFYAVWVFSTISEYLSDDPLGEFLTVLISLEHNLNIAAQRNIFSNATVFCAHVDLILGRMRRNGYIFFTGHCLPLHCLGMIINRALTAFGNNKKYFKNDTLAGITVALALIPEAIAFAFVAGVSPLLSLQTAVVIAFIAALFTGRPGMISASTAAISIAVSYTHLTLPTILLV